MLGFNWLKEKGKGAAGYGKKIADIDNVQKNAKDIGGLAGKLLNPKKIIENSRKETFIEAKNRLSVSDVEIIQNYKNQVYSFYISMFFALICFVGILYNLFALRSILGALSMLSVLAICLANSFRFSFRAFQIKHQKLCSVKEWWDRASEWFPKVQ